MWKYVVSIVAAGLLLGIALRSHGGTDGEASPTDGELVVTGARPEVDRAPAGDGAHDVVVRHKLVGAITRASLVHDAPDGTPRTVATQTDCHRRLEDEGADDGYAAHVHLEARVPARATNLRLVLEDDTGIRVYPLDG